MRRAGLRVPVTETYGNGTIRACGKTLRMLGWHVSVYRQTDGGASPAAFESPEGTRVAVRVPFVQPYILARLLVSSLRPIICGPSSSSEALR
jgi:hypothetical protein